MTLSPEARQLGEEPAFPQNYHTWNSWQKTAGHLGLTKREYLIAAALSRSGDPVPHAFILADRALEQLVEERKATP